MKSDVIPFNFDDFKRVAKHHKKMWVETSDRGDVPPTVFVEKDGQVVATIVAPQVDKHAGLHAAALARMGFDADALSIIMDAHTASVKAKEGATMEEAEAEFRKQYPPGSMQKMCDEEGACERGDIVDVLLCQRIDRDGNFKMFLLPYSYHGKGGPEFKWLDKHPAVEGFDPDAIDNTKCKGFIPEALREIMAQKQFLDQDKIGDLLKELGDGMDVPPERRQYHVSRAILRVLNSQGFMVFDLRKTPDGEEPELIVPTKAVSLAELIPAEAVKEISNLLHEKGGKEDFRDDLIRLIRPYQNRINEKAKELKIPLDVVSADAIAEGISKSFKPDPKPPYRVKVMSGDQSEDWGEGTYVGDVPVFFVAMPDGSLRSLENAEVRPTDEQLAELGGKLMEVGNNPKIVLDNPAPHSGNKIVYGCQCWWESVDE